MKAKNTNSPQQKRATTQQITVNSLQVQSIAKRTTGRILQEEMLWYRRKTGKETCCGARNNEFGTMRKEKRSMIR